MTYSNDRPVIQAKNFLDSALAAQLHLREQYELPMREQDRTVIAASHQQINYGLKCAEVSALVAIAEHLETLASRSFDDHADEALLVATDEDAPVPFVPTGRVR